MEKLKMGSQFPFFWGISVKLWSLISCKAKKIIHPANISNAIFKWESGKKDTITLELSLPERSCLIRPLLVLGSMGRKSLYQVISGSGLPLAAQSMVAVRVRSTTLSWGPMSMLGKPGGSRSSVKRTGTRGQGTVSHIQMCFKQQVRKNTLVISKKWVNKIHCHAALISSLVIAFYLLRVCGKM